MLATKPTTTSNRRHDWRWLKHSVPILISLIGALPVSAHVLKTDSMIGAVIHIDPEDNPIVGQPATFFLSFQDTAHQFKLANCDCQAQILQDEQVIATETVTQGAIAQAGTFTYTFAHRGAYDVHIIGRAKTGGKFNNFVLHYDLRVERTAATSRNDDSVFHFIHYSVIIGAMAIAGGVTLWRSRKKSN